MDHDTHQPTPAGNGHDRNLLERLFELTVNGQQHSLDFARLQQQVHQRLLAAYPDPQDNAVPNRQRQG